MVSIIPRLLIATPIALMTTSAFSDNAWIGTCSCHFDSPAYSCSFDRQIVKQSVPEIYKDCANQSNGHGTVLGIAYGPIAATPPPLVAVDFCADINSRPSQGYLSGTDTGMLGKRAGVSCISVDSSVKKFRVWCHTWEENDPVRHEGFCKGAFDTSEDCPGPGGKNVAYVQRQFGSVKPGEPGKNNICVHVDNLDSGRTLHFDITGSPID